MANADGNDDMTYEERIDAIGRDPSLSRAQKQTRLAALADRKIADQDVSHTQGGSYEYKAPPPIDESPKAQYGSPLLIPTSRSRSARLGSQLGTVAGKFGSGFIEGYEGKKHADEVAAREHAAIAETQRVSARQAAYDRADAGYSYSPPPVTSATDRDPDQIREGVDPDLGHAGGPDTSTGPGSYVYGDRSSPPPVPPPATEVTPQTNVGTTDTAPPEIEMYGDERDLDPTATSDRRSKGSVSREGARDMLRKAPAYSYEYKPDERGPTAPPGRHLGVMAQDLLRSPIGRSFVEKDPDGRLRVNYGQGLGAMMAGLSSISEDVDRLKSGGKRGRR